VSLDGDPLNPQTWFLGMLDAIAGIQSRDHTATTAYLRFVELHRGRAVAEETKARLLQLSRGHAFSNAAQLAADVRELARKAHERATRPGVVPVAKAKGRKRR
jgi:hypothetical protein